MRSRTIRPHGDRRAPSQEDGGGSEGARGPLGAGVELGRVFGVRLYAHWSLLVIFTLIVVSLGAGLFATWHPEWALELRWGLALAAAVLFFASIALHELVHAWVGRGFGISVTKITLFVFGGMAHVDEEAPSPKAEFFMAASGPLASLIIGLVASLAGLWLAAAPLADAPDAGTALASIGPTATLLLWLGPINLLLAVFNMVPGFPLDGGRVLRAALWWGTGDFLRATRWSAALGRGFGWALIGTGVAMLLGLRVPVLGSGPVSGLWLILIGWFLKNAAAMSYQQVVIRQALDHVPVRDVMRRGIVTVAPSTTVESLITDYVMRSDQRSFPVSAGGPLLGIVCLDDLRGLERERWPEIRVEDIMTPRDQLEVMAPEQPAFEALKRLGDRQVDQIPVVEDHGELRGLVRREDVMKWLSLRDPL